MNRATVAAWVTCGAVEDLVASVFMVSVAQQLAMRRQPAEPAFVGEHGLPVLLALLVALIAPAVGRIVDRSQAGRPLFVGGTALALAAMAASALGVSGPALWFALLLALIGQDVARVVYLATLVQVAPAGRRGRVAGWGQAAGPLAVIMAVMMSGLGFLFSGSASLLVPVALGVVLAVPALAALPAPPDAEPSGATAPVRGAALSRPDGRLRHHPLGGFLAAYVIYAMGLGALTAWIPRAGHSHGLNAFEMIVLAGAPLPGLVVGGLACAWAIDRLGPRRVILLALAQAVVIALAVPWARAPILLYACAAVAGVATAPALAASVVLVANRARTGAVAETFGLYLLGSRFAALMAWLLCVLLLRGHGGPYAATLALGGLILLGLLLVQGLIPGDEPADPPGAAATPGSEAAAMASGRSR